MVCPTPGLGTGQLQAASPAATVTVTRTANPAPSSPAPSPTSTRTPGRLTLRQAKAAYLRIGNPANRADSATNQDVTDQAPFSQLLRDNTHSITLTRRAGHQLTTVRWPRPVQPDITAMVLTHVPAQLRSYRAYWQPVASTAWPPGTS